MHMHNVKRARPLTHDLVRSLIVGLGRAAAPRADHARGEEHLLRGAARSSADETLVQHRRAARPTASPSRCGSRRRSSPPRSCCVDPGEEVEGDEETRRPGAGLREQSDAERDRRRGAHRPSSSRRTSRICAPKTSGSSIRRRTAARLARAAWPCARDRGRGAGARQRRSSAAPERPAAWPRPSRARRHAGTGSARSPVPGVDGHAAPRRPGQLRARSTRVRTDAGGRYTVRYRRFGDEARCTSPPSCYRGIAYFSSPLRGAARQRRRRRDHRVRHDVARPCGSPCRAITSSSARRSPTARATSWRCTSCRTTPPSPSSGAIRSRRCGARRPRAAQRASPAGRATSRP